MNQTLSSGMGLAAMRDYLTPPTRTPPMSFNSPWYSKEESWLGLPQRLHQGALQSIRLSKPHSPCCTQVEVHVCNLYRSI